MVKKTLHNRDFFNEIKTRISKLSTDSEKKWGRMNVSQMLCHCDLVLQVPLRNIELPNIHYLFRIIGIFTKREMQIFDNGIPYNMPTFQKLIVNFECNFDEAKDNLLKTLDFYWEAFENKRLPKEHILFGSMKEKDWGFLEYKHLDHHLKQFNV
ncbi:hypothetical protein PFY12_02095 [Chryseobacterium camelliae]|uniref:DUF1569 domain-containing protein n=1 Tax=Chryseobacterium camelliae TaxID=1265445 RepID=A0ABY7QQ61_9FLAO|nr:hypothetical protein [Chryseobacterium camelliae]WBV60923.1 hypothetical protein PFY12_02095 [Chryseobacterium camelliae]